LEKQNVELKNEKLKFEEERKKMNEQQRKNEELRILEERKRKEEENALLCVFCTIEQSTFAIIPCGHKCLCERCVDFVHSCPICRGVKQNVLRIF